MQQPVMRRISAMGAIMLLTLAASSQAMAGDLGKKASAADVPASLLANWAWDPEPERAIISEAYATVPHSVNLKRLDATMVVGISQSMSDWNMRVVGKADSLLRSGFFGDPEEDFACNEASRYLKYHALTAMDFIGYLGAQDRVVWETSERDIDCLFRAFVNPGVYPVNGLKRAILGSGNFFMEFDVEPKYDERWMLGRCSVRLRTSTIERDGQKIPAWQLEMPLFGEDKTRLIYGSHYSGRIRRVTIEEEGAQLQVLVIEDIEGLFIEKSGKHKCAALVIWRNRMPSNTWPPEVPRIGTAAYFPELKLRLPWFLPDVNMNDLRALSTIQPLIASEQCDRDKLPSWVNVLDDGRFLEWGSEGPIPAAIRQWYPDL